MADQDATVDFRAPPPSPVASGRNTFFSSDNVLTEFLEKSLIVPDLILPDRVFPHQVHIQSPPIIDFKSLISSSDDSVIEDIKSSVSKAGCFQLVNHGIERGERRAVLEAGGRIFRLGMAEKKKMMRVFGERLYGFEEDGESEMVEEFVWGIDKRFRMEMEQVWPLEYSNLSEKMESLFLEADKLAQKILLVLEEDGVIRGQFQKGMNSNLKIMDVNSSMCYIHKQCPNLGCEDRVNAIKYHVIKMLIRGSDYYSHALGLHVCDGCSEFHVYSKKGWFSFVPDQDALVVTVGDQLQAWSDGEYKNVVGRPICIGEDKEYTSLTFLCSPVANNEESIETTISLIQQAIMAILFTYAYQFWVYIHKN